MDADALADLLRRVRPSSVVCVMTDGTERPIATAAGRAARWAQTARVALGIGADLERVELRARDGSVIDTWRPSRDVMTDEASAPSSGAAVTPDLALATSVLAAVQAAVDHAVDRHHRTTSATIEALVRVVEATERRAATVERMYIDAMRATQAAVMARLDAEARAAEAASADDDAIAKLAPILGSMLGGGAPKS